MSLLAQFITALGERSRCFRNISQKRLHHHHFHARLHHIAPPILLTATSATNPTMSSPPKPTTEEALQAHLSAKSASRVPPKTTSEITSMNKLLQWSTSKTTSKPELNTPVPKPSPASADREWLDAAFPDPYDEPKKLIALLSSPQTPPLITQETVTALTSLEDLFADLNHAVNIVSLSALTPLLEHAKSPVPQIRAAALWALGTALQNLPEVQAHFFKESGHDLLPESLRHEDAAVRAKAVRIAVALLRHAPPETWKLLTNVGVVPALAALLQDKDETVRKRMLFFLKTASGTGCEPFAVAVAGRAELVDSIFDIVENAAAAEAELACGALITLVGVDRSIASRVRSFAKKSMERVRNGCRKGEEEADLDELRSALEALWALVGS